MTADVIIVGGGLAGAATAFYLSQFNANVVLIEKDSIAYGASGRNGGQVVQLDGRDKERDSIVKRLRYSKANMKLLHELENKLEMNIEFQSVGSIDIASSEEEYEILKNLCSLQNEAGDDEVELLHEDDLKEISPFLANGFFGARYRKTDGNINPLFLTYGFVNRSRENGARIIQGSRVNTVIIESGKVKGVEVANERIYSDIVVLATSAWTRELLPKVKIFPLRSLAVVTEKIPKIEAPGFEVVIENEIFYGATQFENGNVLVGGPSDRPRTYKEQFDYSVTWHDYIRNTSILSRIFPKLKYINVIRCWAGTMATTPDGLPLVGSTSIADGLFFIAGFPNGMAFIPILAKLVSELIITKKPSMDLDIFNPDRFDNLSLEWPQRYNYTIIADYLGRL